MYAFQVYVSTLYVGMVQRKHSCYPNSGDTLYNSDLNEFIVVTSRDVAAGEYITKDHQVRILSPLLPLIHCEKKTTENSVNN